MTKEYIEQPHALLLTGLASLPADKLSGVPRYIRDSCAVISEITEGYLLLRQADKITASRVLIRPCIEAAMKLAAVRVDPNNLLNIAHTEAVSDGHLIENFRDLAKKWLADGRKGVGPETVAAAEQGVIDRKQLWENTRKQLGPQFPTAPAVDKYLKVLMLADAGNQGEFYGLEYAFYCNFVHATLRVANPWPPEVHGQDILGVAKCLRLALRGMESIGGPKIPPELAAKLDALVAPQAKAGP
jgi:hypothetical protein